MNTHFGKAGSLYTFVENSSKLSNLKDHRDYLEHKLKTIDDNIKLYEKLDCGELALDLFAAQYNKINIKRIKVELEINRLEKALLEFELAAALAD